MKKRTCCFTGHRNIPGDDIDKISNHTRTEIEKLIKNDVNIFITGGALGYDSLCATLVLAFKELYPDIKLHLALPCKEQTRGWHVKDIERYNLILRSADGVVYVSDTYTRDCMFKRNRYMIDNSSYCIAYCIKQKGGSFYTIEYAKRQDISIIMV